MSRITGLRSNGTSNRNMGSAYAVTPTGNRKILFMDAIDGVLYSPMAGYAFYMIYQVGGTSGTYRITWFNRVLIGQKRTYVGGITSLVFFSDGRTWYLSNDTYGSVGAAMAALQRRTTRYSVVNPEAVIYASASGTIVDVSGIPGLQLFPRKNFQIDSYVVKYNGTLIYTSVSVPETRIYPNERIVYLTPTGTQVFFADFENPIDATIAYNLLRGSTYVDTYSTVDNTWNLSASTGANVIRFAGDLYGGDYTICLRAYMTTSSTWQRIISMSLSNDGGATQKFVGIDTDNMSTSTYFNASNIGGSRVYLGNFANVWKTVVLVKTASSLFCYVDGQLKATVALGTYTQTYALSISHSSYPFKGQMDTIRIFDRALSEPEVLEQYGEDIPPVLTFNDFAYKITLAAAGTFTMACTYTGTLNINWGDEDIESVTGTTSQSHTYAAAGTYTISLGGTITNIALANNDSLVQIYAPFPPAMSALTSADSILAYCPNLTSVPGALFVSLTNLTNFSGAFTSCSSLQSISSDLFLRNTAATDFSWTFDSCESLTSIPEDLFIANTAAAIFFETFYSCYGLTSIPADLFATNTAATSFEGTFGYCDAITAIPATLFANNTEVLTFNEVFAGCTAITSIPENLFVNNTEVTDFSWAFEETSITSIPENLFATCTEVTDFMGTFDGCANLLSIPANLFLNNTKVTSFKNAFRNCTGLTGAAPALWTMFPSADGTDCFKGCVNLSNYADIPTIWK